MTNIINPSWLETARLVRGFTQEEAAKLLSISQGKLSKAEKGDQSLDESVILRMSSVYDFPVDFFYLDNDRSPDGHLYFRRKLTITGKEISKLLSKIKILKRIIDTLFCSIEVPDCILSAYNPRLNTPEEIARKTRFAMKLYSGKVPNLAELLESYGIIVFPFDFETEKIDGLSVITSNGYKVIFSNSKMPEDRKRFSLAHELGHLIMHFDTPPEYAETVEEEANRFASEFLLPTNEIKDDLSFLNFEKLGRLKRKWHVSMASILRKAKTLGCIDEKSYRNFQINFSKKGYNRQEPILLPIERPSFVRDTIKLFHDELGYDDVDICNLMKINESDYRAFFGTRLVSIFSIS